MAGAIWLGLLILVLLTAYVLLRQAEREEACPICGGHDFDEEGVCTSCGHDPEHGQMMRKREKEYPDETGDTDGAKRGGPLHREGSVVGGVPARGGDYRTEIDPDWDGGDGPSGILQGVIERLRKKNNRGSFGAQKEGKKKTERKKSVRTLLALTSNLGLPERVGERAVRVFREGHENDLIRGRNFDMFIVGSVYAACRESGTPRSLTEILEETPPAVDTKRQDVKNALGLLNGNLELQISVNSSEARATAFIPRLAEELGCVDGVTKKARDITINAGLKIQSLRPAAVAAGAIYHASQQTGRGITKAAVKRASTETKQPVRTAIKRLP